WYVSVLALSSSSQLKPPLAKATSTSFGLLKKREANPSKNSSSAVGPGPLCVPYKSYAITEYNGSSGKSTSSTGKLGSNTTLKHTSCSSVALLKSLMNFT